MLPSEIHPSSALTLYTLFSSTTFSLLDLHCFQKTCESVIASIDTPTIAGSCKVVFLCVIPAVLQKQEWLWSCNRDRKRIEFMWNHRIRMKSSEKSECFLLEFQWWAFMSPPTFPHLTRRTTGKHFHISTSTGTRAAFSQTHNTTSFNNDIPLTFFIDISPLIVLTWMSCWMS